MPSGDAAKKSERLKIEAVKCTAWNMDARKIHEFLPVFCEGEKALIEAVLECSLCDAVSKKLSPEKRRYARQFIKDRFPSAWGETASGLAELIGKGEAWWKARVRGVLAGKIKPKRNYKGKEGMA